MEQGWFRWFAFGLAALADGSGLLAVMFFIVAWVEA